jgi:molecular chaperone GrpE
MTDKKSEDWKEFDEDLEEMSNVGASAESLNNSVGEPALEHPSYLALEEKLTLAEKKADANWEKSVRAMAELENVRRRAEREVENATRYALERFANSLLPVVDSLDQALQTAEKREDVSMSEGLALTMKLFIDVLERFHIKQLDPEGELFNPQMHEAMTMQEAQGVEPNTVINVLQKGYTLNERVIRPARVIVAK